MKRKYKVWLVVIVLLILILFSVAIYLIKNPIKDKEQIKVNVLDTIEGYGYKIDDRDSSYYKSEFENLKTILSSEVNYEDYSKQVAKMFIIDLYSIGTKVNKYDVGGVEYYHTNKVTMYDLKIKETLYDLVEDDSYGDRTQELPIVSSVEVLNISNIKYKVDNEEVDAYKIELKWTYEKDLGYDNNGTIIIVKDGNRQSVVSYKPNIESEE